MYDVLLQMARISLPDENLDEVNPTNLKCCHIRLFDDMSSDHMPSLIANSCSSTNRLIEKLKTTVEHTNETICLMPASSNTLKFSVYSEDDNTCNFVHITDNIITCQSGYCDSCYSTYKR